MKTENIIFLFWAVIFILILCQLFYFGPKKEDISILTQRY